MSNPAVIKLSELSGSEMPFDRFVIEDNLGESIHLHIDNMRMDFSIEEYLSFSTLIRSSVEELNVLHGYNINEFDENFLKECSSYLQNLRSIEVSKVKISDLKCIVHKHKRKGLLLQMLSPVNQTPAYKYLEGDVDSFKEYNQFNYFGINNEQRLVKILDSVRFNGYPLNNSHIIIFNGQNIVRDGQHRLAVLAHIYGVDHIIDVQKFIFEGSSQKINIYKNNIKCSAIWVVRNVCRSVKSVFK